MSGHVTLISPIGYYTSKICRGVIEITSIKSEFCDGFLTDGERFLMPSI